jgi:osmotically-inducible protein OsmY
MRRALVRIVGNRLSASTLAALLLATVSAAGCSRSDATLQEELQKELAEDPRMAGSRVTVTVNQGQALIKGETQSAAQQQRAVDIARAVKGLTQVQTEMRLSDAGLTQELEKAIAADQSVNQVPLRVEVKDAEVKLYSDQTNADQRARLREIAGGIPGVTRVEDNMK